VVFALAELRIDVAHRVDDCLNDRHERRLFAAEEPRVTNGAPKNATQYVASAFIRREYSVGEKERDGTRVVGQYAEGRRMDRVGDDVGSAVILMRP